MRPVKLTQHVSIFILTSTFLSNVARDTQEQENIVLSRVICGVQPADIEGSLAAMQFNGPIMEFGTKSRKREGVTSDFASIESKCWARV